MDFDPGRFCGSAKGLDAVTGTSVSANDPLFLGFRKHIHNAFEALGPITFGEAVHEANVDMIDAEFAAETVEIFASSGRIGRPRLGELRELVTRDERERVGARAGGC